MENHLNTGTVAPWTRSQLLHIHPQYLFLCLCDPHHIKPAEAEAETAAAEAK